MVGGGNIGQRDRGRRLNSPLDSPLLLCVRQRGFHAAEHAVVVVFASLLVSRVAARLKVVEHLDAKILEAISAGASLDMSTWHTCETTHCRAGFAVHLAGAAGYELEKQLGSQRAGAAIYRASTGRVPHFFANNEAALLDIRECAAEQEAK